MESKEKVFKFDEIKKLLQLPKFSGMKFVDSCHWHMHSFKYTLPQKPSAPANLV